MNFEHYISESDQYMHSLYMCMDNAWSAEKMYDWSNIGVDNAAWSEGPYISAGANSVQIDRNKPYCLRVSRWSSMVAGYQIGPNPEVGPNGGVYIGNDKDRIKANVIIPTVSICMQFALLEAFDFDSFRRFVSEQDIDENDKSIKRYDRRPVRSRMESLNELTVGKVSNNVINAYESVSNFRNMLTHEPQVFCNDPGCAIDVYLVCQGVAASIQASLFGNQLPRKALHRKEIWDKRLESFDAVVEF